MKKIDQQTVQRILDTADIVEVVSDFVSLKKRGANYMGLCPFHNERTPSFSVSKSKRIYKCFSCGKGGSTVNFVMEHEQLSYYEALKYLAKKYHIEIKERELTDEERQQATERESLLAVNDFALGYFSKVLTDTPEGRDIGLAYFRERGINDAMVKKFALGYSLDKSDALLKSATSKGYNEKYLLDTGLCARSERTGSIYDRFRGRVMYPVFSVSGRPVAFGGRTLRSDKSMAKYVNSPESPIYHKSNELYGLYQAKQAIVKANKCILVEGYMDVISMHQVGVENVVASSGTSLTDGQIRLIHRFAENVTVIYDADPAGIKASLRGIDLLLAQGLNIKVLLLPDGEDPDSFAQKHTGAEVLEYIAANETDFMRFKTRILLEGVANDPVGRAKVINEIINSIAEIPDNIIRAEYIKECAHMLDIGEDVLSLQLKKKIALNLQKKRTGTSGHDSPSPQELQQPNAQEGGITAAEVMRQTQQPAQAETPTYTRLKPQEQELMKYVVRYGLNLLDPGSAQPITVLEYITSELSADELTITDPSLRKTLERACQISVTSWPGDYEAYLQHAGIEYSHAMAAGEEVIRQEATDLADIEAREKMLKAKCDSDYQEALSRYINGYLQQQLLSDPDDDVRHTAADLSMDKYILSKVHTRYTHIETEEDRIPDLVPRAVVSLKLEVLNIKIKKIERRIMTPKDDTEVLTLLMEQKKLFEIRAQFAKYLGERIVTPK